MTLRAVSSTFIMISPPLALLLQAALCLVASAQAATNYSVDDQDPLFHYSGHWERITGSDGMDMDGGHMLASDPGLSATITYTCAYLLEVNSIIIKSSQPILFPPFFSFFNFEREIDGLNEYL